MTLPASAEIPPPQALDEMLCFAIYSAGLAFNRLYKPLLDRLGLTYPQYLVLLLLRDQRELSVSALGEQLFLESNTITPLIKRMEAHGMVSRRRDTADERVVRVALTEAGRALARQAECIPEAVITATGKDAAALGTIRDELLALRRTLRPDAA